MSWDPLSEARAKLVSLSLTELVALRGSIDAELTARVADYRRDGETWAYIANCLGVSQSEAHRRYSVMVNALLKASPDPPVLPGQREAF